MKRKKERINIHLKVTNSEVARLLGHKSLAIAKKYSETNKNKKS